MSRGGHRMDATEGRAAAAIEFGLPEVMLVIAVILISPIALTNSRAGQILLSMVGMFVCSMVYLRLTSFPKGQGLFESIMKKNLGRSGKIYVAYVVVLLLYWSPLVVTIDTKSFAPFALFFAFMPFHATGVLVVTVANRGNAADKISGVRVLLAVLLLVCALAWPVVLVSGFGLT